MEDVVFYFALYVYKRMEKMNFDKKRFKKIIKNIAVTSLTMMQLLAFRGYGAMIDEDAYEIAVSRGISHKRVVQTYENGVRSIFLTFADLGDPSLGVDLLYNKKTGFVNRQELSSLTEQNSNAVVSINGDFFSMSNPSYAMGIMVDKGKLISSPFHDAGKMASVIVDANNQVVFDYLASGVVLHNDSTGQSYNSASINKASGTYAYPVILTSEYRQASAGSTDKLKVTEMVVNNGIVQEIRKEQKSVAIPKNGFVVTVSGTKAQELEAVFRPGDTVSISSSAQNAYNDMVTAFGGGTLILKNGQKTPLTHQIKGKSQRTAVGLTYDNKLVFMVTDGRNNAYIGMDENDVADFLQGQNVKDAMMLDGGGSTQMMINGSITNNMTAAERKLLNGIAVSNKNPKGSLAKIEAVLETASIVQGDKVKLLVQGFDASMNPVKLGAVSVTGNGVNVTYNNGYITANSGGKGSLLVSSGGASTSLPVEIHGINPVDPKLKESTGVMDLAIIPNGSTDKEDALGQVLNGRIVEKAAKASLSVNMFNKNQELSNSLKGAKESIYKGGQILKNSGVTFLGLDTSKGIGGTAGQWTAIKNALASSDDYLIIMTSGASMEPSEKKVFRKLLNDASKHKSIYVVYQGASFKSHVEGSVSYISIMDNATAKGSDDSNFRMLSFRKQDGKLLYSFERLF